MNNIIEEAKIYVKLNKDDFMRFIHYEENVPIFKLIKDKYEIWEYQVQNAVKARVRFTKDFVMDEMAFYVILTLGEDIDRLITNHMEKGEYLETYVINAMADWYLFLAEEKVRKMISDSCKRKGIGIKKRLEPFNELPPEFQYEIINKTKGSEWGISITKGYMLYPQKTMGYVLIIDDRPCVYPKGHSCDKCSHVDCDYRSHLSQC